jgi:hypothetical protein
LLYLLRVVVCLPADKLHAHGNITCKTH